MTAFSQLWPVLWWGAWLIELHWLKGNMQESQGQRACMDAVTQTYSKVMWGWLLYDSVKLAWLHIWIFNEANPQTFVQDILEAIQQTKHDNCQHQEISQCLMGENNNSVFFLNRLFLCVRVDISHRMEVRVYPTLHWYVSESILPRRLTRLAFNSQFQGAGRGAVCKM